MDVMRAPRKLPRASLEVAVKMHVIEPLIIIQIT